MRRPLSINLASLVPTLADPDDLRSALTLARDFGYAGVQLDITPAGLRLKELARTGQRELLRIIASSDLRLTTLQTTTGRAGLTPGADVGRVIEHLEASLRLTRDLSQQSGTAGLRLCVDLGRLPPVEPQAPAAPPPVDPILAGVLLLPTADSLRSLGLPTTPTAPHTPTERRDPAFESQVDAALHEVGRHADGLGVLVAFRSSLSPHAALHRTLTAASCPYFTLDLDPVALLSDPWTLEQTLSAFPGPLGHVRLRDALRGSAGRTQPTPLGQGDTNLPALLSALEDAAYPGPLTLDPTDLPNRLNAAQSAPPWWSKQFPPSP